MEKAGNNGFVYKFGKFVLDPKKKTLFSGRKPIHLPAKEFETLLLLVENNRKALSKDEMMRWLERSLQEGDPTLSYIRFFARYDFVRDDPRFQAVVQKTRI